MDTDRIEPPRRQENQERNRRRMTQIGRGIRGEEEPRMDRMDTDSKRGRESSTNAALSAMRTWIGGHPDTRMNSRIRVSADPPDRQIPVSATCVSNLKILCIWCPCLRVILISVYPCASGSLVPLLPPWLSWRLRRLIFPSLNFKWRSNGEKT